MRINIMIDGLEFQGLTDEQLQQVEANAGEAIIKETPKGWKVQGTAKELYMLMYHLSYDNDIEII